jgi:hypothetical protein
MQYAPLQLLSALDQQALPLNKFLAGANPQDLANTALACGKLGYRGTLLPGALLQQAVQLLQDGSRGGFNMQELCNLCWCAAVLDLRQCVPQVLQLAAECKQMWATAVNEGLQQLYQAPVAAGPSAAGTWSGSAGCAVTAAAAAVQGQLGAAADRAGIIDKGLRPTQVSVCTVQALPAGTWQQPPVLEQPTADGAHSIDIAATTMSGVRLAIEVDGPYHFVRPNRTHDGGVPEQGAGSSWLCAGQHPVLGVEQVVWGSSSSSSSSSTYRPSCRQQHSRRQQQQQAEIQPSSTERAPSVSPSVELQVQATLLDCTSHRSTGPTGIGPASAYVLVTGHVCTLGTERNIHMCVSVTWWFCIATQ